jgi:hypothetical protein
MSLLVSVFQALTLLNLVLLTGLAYVWGRNYATIRSKHSLGLLLFALFLLGENGMAAYFFLLDPTLTGWITDPELVPPVAQGAMAALRVAQFVGLSFLTWITWD